MDKSKNILDLRPKVEPEIKVVEKLIIQKRRPGQELLKLVIVIAISSLVIWGISRADNATLPKPAAKNFSVMGIVSDIGSTTFSMSNLKGGDAGVLNYTFDTKHLKTIETEQHIVLTLSDIAPGFEIVAQGVESEDSPIAIRRIISLGLPKDDLKLATTTEATSTLDTTASSTLPIATSTINIATSTTSIASSTTPMATTTTDTTASSTIPVATTTDSTATTTDITTNATSTATTTSSAVIPADPTSDSSSTAPTN